MNGEGFNLFDLPYDLLTGNVNQFAALVAALFAGVIVLFIWGWTLPPQKERR